MRTTNGTSNFYKSHGTGFRYTPNQKQRISEYPTGLTLTMNSQVKTPITPAMRA
jgi:hypothetical protein